MAYTLRGSIPSGSLTPSSFNVVAGDIIAVWVKTEVAAPTAIADNAAGGTNTYVTKTLRSHSNGDLFGRWFYCLSAKATEELALTITAAGAAYPYVGIYIITPTAVGYFDVESLSTNNSASTNATTPTFSTADTDEIVLAGYGNYGGGTPSAASIGAHDATTEIIADASPNGASWYHIFTETLSNVVATGTITSSVYITTAIAFKATAGGGASTTPAKMDTYRRRRVT
jgi:hypothetical protein